MEEAKSDLVNVLSSLEAHWHVLEAEVVEINRDIDYCEQCLRKYGEWFNSPLQYLRELKRTKKNKMCNYPHIAPPHTARGQQPPPAPVVAGRRSSARWKASMPTFRVARSS